MNCVSGANNRRATKATGRCTYAYCQCYAVADWSEAELRQAEDGWSAAEILAHIRASDDILAPRAIMILVRDDAPLNIYNERRWSDVVGYAQRDFHTSLSIYTARRAELVATLHRIAPADWDRRGVHEVHGPVSLLATLAGLLEHEEEHCAQLEALRVR